MILKKSVELAIILGVSKLRELSQVLLLKVIHPKGGAELGLKKREISALIADTFDGKIHINGIRKHKSRP
ncbi:MAG: hypothetical protein EPN17_04920 [Methylobacter sp.]|nr:MAG: hypothetical protein EPN17_04920 [Methylobacter sp.]